MCTTCYCGIDKIKTRHCMLKGICVYLTRLFENGIILVLVFQKGTDFYLIKSVKNKNS